MFIPFYHILILFPFHIKIWVIEVKSLRQKLCTTLVFSKVSAIFFCSVKGQMIAPPIPTQSLRAQCSPFQFVAPQESIAWNIIAEIPLILRRHFLKLLIFVSKSSISSIMYNLLFFPHSLLGLFFFNPHQEEVRVLFSPLKGYFRQWRVFMRSSTLIFLVTCYLVCRVPWALLEIVCGDCSPLSS